LIEAERAFAAGLVICGASISSQPHGWDKQEPKHWLVSSVQAFAAMGVSNPLDSFRCNPKNMPEKVDNALIVNPKLLLNPVMEAFQKQSASISMNRSKVLAENLRPLLRG
jgi:hypothetical protein